MINIEEIQEQFPFISGIKIQESTHIGIIQNSNDKIITFYDFQMLKNDQATVDILNLGEIWWWDSNRKLPINIFLPEQMRSFRYCQRTANKKHSSVLFGPCVNLSEVYKKRSKRKQISLVHDA